MAKKAKPRTRTRARRQEAEASSAVITKELVDELARRKWESSGLTAKDARALRLEAIFDKKHPRLRIPYFDLNGAPITEARDVRGFATEAPFCRERYLEDRERGILAPPAKSTGGKARLRFMQPNGARPYPYFPQNLGRTWTDVAADPRVTIYITEGELKAAAGCAAGLPTIGLGGVFNFASRKHKIDFLPELDAIEWTGRAVAIVFDSDAADIKDVRRARGRLTQKLQERGVATVNVAEIPPTDDGEKQGLDDYYAAHGAEATRALVGQAAPAADAPEDSTFSVLCRAVRNEWGFREAALGPGRLAWNLMTFAPELDGTPLMIEDAVSRVREHADAHHDWRVSAADAEAAIRLVAREHGYSPVREYLDHLPAWSGADRVEQVVRDVLRVTQDDKLSRELVRRWLIGAVARVMQPGCKMDNVLTLVGPGGIFKSTFVKTLAGEWFGDTHLDLKYRHTDALMTLHRCWIYEWAELSVLRQADVETVKNLASSATDQFRPPWGRAAMSYPRAFVLAATTNEDDFLAIPDRRFWPVSLRHVTRDEPINCARLAAIRDDLWANVLALFKGGERWHLAEADEVALRERHEEHRERDGAEDEVLAYIKSTKPDGATSDEILTWMRRWDTNTPPVNAGGRSFWAVQDYARVKRILKTAGYKRVRPRDDGGERDGASRWRHPSWPAPARGNPKVRKGRVVKGEFGKRGGDEPSTAKF